MIFLPDQISEQIYDSISDHLDQEVLKNQLYLSQFTDKGNFASKKKLKILKSFSFMQIMEKYLMNLQK